MPSRPFATRLLGALISSCVAVALVPVRSAGASEATVPLPAPTEATGEAVAGRIVVSWEGIATASDRVAIRNRYGLRHGESIHGVGAEVVTVPVHAADRLAAALGEEADVALAEPDFLMRAATNDPGWSNLWGLHNAGQSGGTADVDIDAPEAWQATRGSGEVVVAVIDTGIDINHPDLAGNIWRNAGEIAGNGVDDDGNGYVDDVNGWDFLNGDNTIFDSASADSHGTHVAGTIAATADNGIGVAGVAPGVRIMPLKFLGADGSGSSSAAAAAVAYARANGATVINASWGGGNSTTLRNAIAASTGVAVVAAAGNEGVNVDGGDVVQYPAGWAKDSYAVPNIVSVASVDRYGARSSFSNYGASSVDVGAPGSSIVSTAPGSSYASASGTSMAAPHASGVAALVATIDRTMTGAGLVGNVKAGAQPLASMAGTTTTGGLVNAHASVQLAASAPPPAPGGGGGSTGGGGGGTGGGTTTTQPDDGDGTVTDPAPSPAPYDGNGARSLDWACPDVTTSGFADVTADSAHALGVGCAAAWQVVSGSSSGRFDPHTTLTRGQLASVLARAIEKATGEALPTVRDHFTDDQGSVHRDSIDKLAAAGIVTGLTTSTYGPGAPVTRGQFATMLGRTYRHLTGTLPGGTDAFTDDDGNTHEPAVNGLAALGVVAGTADGRYHPAASLARAQAATLVARLLDALVEGGVADPVG